MALKSKEFKHSSPWTKELLYDRKVLKLKEDIKTDVAIIGGGIAGMSSAFFTLRFTDKDIVLIDAGRIGHGATGHNAGQVVDYFEKPFSEIVEEYGLQLAAEGQNAVTSAWNLLEWMIIESGMNISFSKVIGHAGCTNLEQLHLHFENKLLKLKGGVEVYTTLVADNFDELDQIDPKYSTLYEVVPQSEILEILETEDKSFIAALKSRKGCINSALFVEKLARYLMNHYPDRFRLIENIKVRKVFLDKDKAVLETKKRLIDTKRVVLCTNGFENFEIENCYGGDINKKYHSMVYSIVGYMTGYIEDKEREPMATSFFTKHKNGLAEDPYFYLTRRNHRSDEQDRSLICLGGPERIKEKDEFKYSPNRKFPKQMRLKLEGFLKKSFKFFPKNLEDLDFKWHGLMGYTDSGIRYVGEEPMNKVLLYNLGCNGVGILPSIFGGKKISDHLTERAIPKTIFDPEVQRQARLNKRTKK
jgi:glycine/D-amino acid oxidase-like deaminating enzyme